jgi:hypothetical protein
MKITVKDVMSSQIVAVRRGATFKEMAGPGFDWGKPRQPRR